MGVAVMWSKYSLRHEFTFLNTLFGWCSLTSVFGIFTYTCWPSKCWHIWDWIFNMCKMEAGKCGTVTERSFVSRRKPTLVSLTLPLDLLLNQHTWLILEKEVLGLSCWFELGVFYNEQKYLHAYWMELARMEKIFPTCLMKQHPSRHVGIWLTMLRTVVLHY